MAITVQAFTTTAIPAHLAVLARLCTQVFREWPHLYDGDGRYDAAHLRTLATSPGGVVLIAYDGEQAIGASTGLPLADATANVQAPFLAQGLALHRFFYLAESVLLPSYRGHGIGKRFFALRETHASAVGSFDFSCFCATQRAQDHPARPAGAEPLDAFWRGQGYAAVPTLQCRMAWREIGQRQTSEVTLRFWVKSLTGRSAGH